MNGNFTEKKLEISTDKKSNIIIRLIKLLIWIFIIFFLFSYYNYNKFKTKILINEVKNITINEGETTKNLPLKLGINNTYLKLYIKNNYPDYKLIKGDFIIPENANIDIILNALQHPIIADEINITILEGWNIFDIDESLTNKGIISKNEYINYVNNSEKIEKLTEFFHFLKGLKTLEGYLYPDTYKINIKTIQINQIVIAQLENFETKVYNKLFLDENGKQKYTNEEIEKIINLASIVEKEEKNSNNKPIVAGILKKRLEEGWMIGADATVCYPHNLTSEECKMVVTKYIKEISEYNTRTKIGLPKTPISNPSYDTINATINYKESPYYYYLHDTKTGKIYYGTTNTEHEANKKYLY